MTPDPCGASCEPAEDARTEDAVTVGSLCSGYGGLDLGLALALGVPLRHAWHVEYDKHPSAILAARFPGVPNYGDLKTTDWTAVERVDWLTAGYPCQPFSGAGKRKGEDDPRHLWPGVAHAIRVLRPRRVLLENVAGHLSLGFGQVLGDLAALRYDTRWLCLRAADAGAPHGRARIFIIATDTTSVGAQDEQARGNDLVPPLSALAGAGGRDRAGDHAEGDRLLGRRTGVVASETAPLAANDGCERSGRSWDGRPRPADGDLDGYADKGAGSPPRPEAQAGGGRVFTWGAYEPAIRRWERVTGRSAPGPTEPGRNGERLSAPFVEWMMGLEAGWVTGVPGLPRNAQLKALGNGVVPQQAALAVRLLTATTAAEVAA